MLLKKNGLRIISGLFLAILMTSCTPDTEETAIHTATAVWTAAPAPTITITTAPTIITTPTQPDEPHKGNSAGLIAFYSKQGRNTDIVIMQTDGSNLVQLTNDPGYDDSPAISPDGAQVLFLTARHDPNPSFPDLLYEIYVMNIDGSNLQRLTTTDAVEDHPAWSPDGSKILFDADYDKDGFYEIYTMNLDGTDLTRLTSNQANDQFADWSPDGSQIAFSSYRDENWNIYLMDSDGSNQHPLTDSPDWELFPAWSPDGTQIAFNGLKPGSYNTDVFVMRGDGSDLRQLTGEMGYDENPAWSPDGKQIAFQTNRNSSFQIFIMNVDGSDQHSLTKGSWPSWVAVNNP